MSAQNPLGPLLSSNQVVLLDGGLATELERRGADLDDPLWSAKLLIEAPALIRELHLDYFRAGAQIGTTASYQASFEGFGQRGLDRSQAAALMTQSVELANEARDAFVEEAGGARPLVAASVGCYGATLHDGSEYRGDYGLTLEELLVFHRPRLQVLAASGCDLLACETIPSRLEAEALVRLLEEMPEAHAWVSFSCANGRDVAHGETLASCIELVSRSDRVVACGINCTPPGFVSDLLATLEGVTDKPLVVYPNSGERWDGASHRWIATSHGGSFVALARDWHRLGARLIGGCCRTSIETIAQLSAQFDKSG